MLIETGGTFARAGYCHCAFESPSHASTSTPRTQTHHPPERQDSRLHPRTLLLTNGLIRIASAASGQLFAFVLAERVGARASTGALLVGLTGASFYVVELAGAPVAGHLADSVGHARVLRWGPLFGVVAMLTGALAALGQFSLLTLGVVLVAARVCEGASAACAVPATLALLAQETEGSGPKRLRLTGLFEITSLIGLILGYALAGTGWDALGPSVFLTLPVVYGAAWFLVRERGTVGVARRADSEHRARTPVWRTLRSLATQRGAVSFAVAWLAVNAVVGVWMQQSPYLFKLPMRSSSQALVGGYSASVIGMIFGVWGITFLAGIALWSFAAPRWPRRRILGTALAGMGVVVATLWLVNHGAPRMLLIVGIIAVMVESGFTPAAFAHLADLTDVDDTSRGTLMGTYSVLLGAGQLIGVVAGAPFAARWQMDGVLAVTALLAVVAMVGVAGMRSHDVARSDREPGDPADSSA